MRLFFLYLFNISSSTPLHIAISSQNMGIATNILSIKATDINLKDNDGITLLRLAIQTKRPDFIELLLEKSALSNDIMVDEWRKEYGKWGSDIVMLSERQSGEKSIRFIAERELQYFPPQVEIRGGADRRLL